MKIRILLSAFLLLVTGCLLAQEVNGNESIVKVSKCVSGDCINGYGRYEFSSGEYYEGEWKNGKRNGQGTNVHSNGTNLTGVWENDILLKSTPSLSASNNIANLTNTCETFQYNQTSSEYEIKDAGGNVIKHSNLGGEYDPIEGLSAAYLEFEDDWGDSSFKKYGFIDSKNRVVIPFEYKDVENFYNGVALVTTDDKHHGLIDKEGKQIHSFIADAAFSLGDNYIVVKQNNQFSLFDRAGKFLSISKYEDISNTNTDLIRVKYNNKYGYTDVNLNEVIPMIYQNAERFEDGFARVSTEYYKWGVINSAGKVVIPIKYQYIDSFHEGLAAVQFDELWGYMDITGKIVIPIKFFEAYNFSDGKAQVKSMDFVEYSINKKGEKVN